MPQMNIYVLKAINFRGYDMYEGFVIRATNDIEARQIANEKDGDNWLDPRLTSCRLVTPDGESGIVMADFHDG